MTLGSEEACNVLAFGLAYWHLTIWCSHMRKAYAPFGYRHIFGILSICLDNYEEPNSTFVEPCVYINLNMCVYCEKTIFCIHVPRYVGT